MNIKERILKINSFISKMKWFDMDIQSIKGGDLMIAGSIDFTYGHTLEVVFEEVYFMSVHMEWSVNTLLPVFSIAEGSEAFTINKQYAIEQGNTLFKISSEDVEEPFYVAAKDIRYNMDSVLYYKKEKLAPNERIADWVKQ